jgi:DNA-binding transcriptional LysR family regulator
VHLRGVDTNLIIALRALLVHQNVTRAARDVGLTQSSMSHALSRLRAHFGDPLLIPAGRKLKLTERGQALVAPVAVATAELERVFARRDPFDPRSSRRVFRITATDNLELYVLPRLAATLQRQAPGIEVRTCALGSDWAEALQRGDVELKLGRKYPVPATLESEDLSDEPFACVVRGGHPAQRRPTAADYAALGHVVVAPPIPPDCEPASQIDSLLARHGLTRRVAMTVAHFLVAPFVVARSDLALTAPARLLDPFVRPLGLRRLVLPIEIASYQLSQVWAARSRDDQGHRWLRGVVAQLFVAGRRRHPGPLSPGA